ncbi:MAG: type IV pili twitching motility protein PilT, partial [Pseudomonadota bacterium]|nr:type IV pili twitching motility protein PilT [Pseudomonadota bacterium]
MSMDKFLRLMVEKTASDLFITAGVPPSMKVHGKLVPLNKTVLSAEQAKDIVYGLMNDRQQAEFEERKELNFAINATGIGRFRASA